MADPRGHVVLVGDDRVGVRVLEELVELGVEIQAVCSDERAPFARAAEAGGVPIVIGDPQRHQTMHEAGIAHAVACGLLAGADLANLSVALALEELSPQARVVLRLFNSSLAGTVQRLVGDVTVLSAEEIAAPAFVEAALRGSADFGCASATATWPSRKPTATIPTAGSHSLRPIAAAPRPGCSRSTRGE